MSVFSYIKVSPTLLLLLIYPVEDITFHIQEGAIPPHHSAYWKQLNKTSKAVAMEHHPDISTLSLSLYMDFRVLEVHSSYSHKPAGKKALWFSEYDRRFLPSPSAVLKKALVRPAWYWSTVSEQFQSGATSERQAHTTPVWQRAAFLCSGCEDWLSSVISTSQLSEHHGAEPDPCSWQQWQGLDHYSTQESNSFTRHINHRQLPPEDCLG